MEDKICYLALKSLDPSPETQSIKGMIDKLCSIKTENVSTVRDTADGRMRQASVWEKILAKHKPNKGGFLIFYFKERSKLNKE